LSHVSPVVITGVGLHTGHGATEATWAALGDGRSALTTNHPWNEGWGEPTRVGPTSAGFPAAPAPDPAPTEFLADRKSIKYMGPCTQMSVLAAGRALRDAGLLQASAEPERAATALFVATGPIAFDVEQALQSIGKGGAAALVALKQEALRRCHPLLPFKMLLNMPLGLVSITFGIKGPNAVLYPGPEQGACALCHAVRGLRQGRFSRALVGGSGHTLSLAPLLGLQRERRLAASIEEAQPFSPQHLGWAPADQAAFLLLETEAEAARRGRASYAVLDQANLLGPGSADHLWRSLAEHAPDTVFATGTRSAAEMDADRARATNLWGRAVTMASADGLIGIAPAASWLVAAAIACLALRQNVLPTSLLERVPSCAAQRVLVSFHDGQSAAGAVLSRWRGSA